MVKIALSLSLFLSLVAAGGWFESCDNKQLSPEGVVSASCATKDRSRNDVTIDLKQSCINSFLNQIPPEGLESCTEFELFEDTASFQAVCPWPDVSSTTNRVHGEWSTELFTNNNGVLAC